jgi:hypothetical protein
LTVWRLFGEKVLKQFVLILLSNRLCDAISLADVKPDNIRAWKKSFIGRAGKDEALRRRYAVRFSWPAGSAARGNAR